MICLVFSFNSSQKHEKKLKKQNPQNEQPIDNDPILSEVESDPEPSATKSSPSAKEPSKPSLKG